MHDRVGESTCYETCYDRGYDTHRNMTEVDLK